MLHPFIRVRVLGGVALEGEARGLREAVVLVPQIGSGSEGVLCDGTDILAHGDVVVD